MFDLNLFLSDSRSAREFLSANPTAKNALFQRALAATMSSAIGASASILRSLSRRAASSFILVLVGTSAAKPAMDGEGRKVQGACNRSRSERSAARRRVRRRRKSRLKSSSETVEIAVEAPDDPAPSERRRFALLNVPRELFNKALGDAARRSKSQHAAISKEGR